MSWIHREWRKLVGWVRVPRRFASVAVSIGLGLMLGIVHDRFADRGAQKSVAESKRLSEPCSEPCRDHEPPAIRQKRVAALLRTPFRPNFSGTPLRRAVEQMAAAAHLKVEFDSEGLELEGVSLETPVTLSLSSPVSLKSMLNLVLQPIHLDYSIRGDILVVTSQEKTRHEPLSITYDLRELSDDAAELFDSLICETMPTPLGPGPWGVQPIDATHRRVTALPEAHELIVDLLEQCRGLDHTHRAKLRRALDWTGEELRNSSVR